MWGPLVVSWVIDPINYIDISTINHTELPILKESCVCVYGAIRRMRDRGITGGTFLMTELLEHDKRRCFRFEGKINLHLPTCTVHIYIYIYIYVFIYIYYISLL